MIYTVKITDDAEQDIRLLRRYIADELGNPSSAFRQAYDIYDAIETLDEMPARYPLAVLNLGSRGTSIACP